MEVQTLEKSYQGRAGEVKRLKSEFLRSEDKVKQLAKIIKEGSEASECAVAAICPSIHLSLQRSLQLSLAVQSLGASFPSLPPARPF